MSTDRDPLAVEDASAPSPEEAAPAEPSEPGDAAAPAAPADDTGAGTDGDGRAAEDGAREEESPQERPAPAAGAGSAAGAEAPASGGGSRSAAAEALAAAVRAVESGERPAASFFTGPSGGRRAAAAPVPGSGASPRPERVTTPAPTAPATPAPPRPAPHISAEGLDGVRQVLTAGGAPQTLAGQVVGVLGEQAAETLRDDPWQLLAVPGVRPEQADGFARALLGPECGPGDERRGQALVGWLLERAALAGHTVLEASVLRTALGKQSVPEPDEALQSALAEGSVLVFQEALETPGAARPEQDGSEAEVPVRLLLGLDRYAMAEESLADGLTRLISTLGAETAHAPADAEAVADGGGDGQEAGADSGTGTESPADSGTDGGPAPSGTGSGAAPDWEAAAAAAPSPSAAELIRAVAASGLVTHSGGEAARAEPLALVLAARALGLRACAAAHTEDGKRRLVALGDPDAVTVTGLLSGQEGPGRDAEGALALDVLAVLDAPQLDVETAAMLVESLTDGTRLVLSGDPGVLWSAGPGRVFADVVAARACPAVVSRTPDAGPIGELVSGIGVGELTTVDAPGKEVVIVPVRDAGEAVHRTVQLVADSVPRAIGVPADHTQVITPGHGGAVGTRALNAALKERLNPGPGRFGGFDPGDRVAYVPAPGRMVPGTVVSADAAGLRLDCADSPVVVPPERVGETVRHGWAVTAHQAAGTRWPAAVVVLPGDAAQELTRSWVYTAFSRGERHLSVVHGVDQALPRAVAEIPAKERTTRLRSLLRAPQSEA
ncbi:helix-hairpin-helix domain-containing protein [Streptomyces syringium]|uniref:helix-hairpin-helix domain-containing protein n=1 Tax=Streptomyces syringium TaxID=76729 RepID=UPI0033F6D014